MPSSRPASPGRAASLAVAAGTSPKSRRHPVTPPLREQRRLTAPGATSRPSREGRAGGAAGGAAERQPLGLVVAIARGRAGTWAAPTTAQPERKRAGRTAVRCTDTPPGRRRGSWSSRGPSSVSPHVPPCLGRGPLGLAGVLVRAHWTRRGSAGRAPSERSAGALWVQQRLPCGSAAGSTGLGSEPHRVPTRSQLLAPDPLERRPPRCLRAPTSFEGGELGAQLPWT